MNILSKSFFQKGVATILLLFFLISPISSHAATKISYQPRTTQELLAYLYGQIIILQTLLEARESGEYYDYDEVIVKRNSSSAIEIETLSARDVQDDEAYLRAEIDLDGERSATIWIEYGEDRDMDDRTDKKKVYDSRGDIQTFAFNVENLDEDEKYYYRAVGEDSEGDREYGSVKTFYTEDNSGSFASYGDFSLEVSDTSIEEGDEVDIDWEIPGSDEGSTNWIGLYEVRDDNRDYIAWKYISYDDEGTVTFRIEDTGEYEFRLFLNNSYDDEITSDEIEVY